MRRLHAFTLVELLVVITIIVVLLAMLAPAMDRAKYQAQLTVCGTRLKAIATGATIYTTDNNRHYPDRTSDPDLYQSGMFMATTIRDYDGKFEWRPVLRKYMGLRALIDPLSETIDLSEGLNPPNEMVMASYDIRFGWQQAGERGMFRFADRWTWTDNYAPGGARAYGFNVLASDHDRVARGFFALGSHPDDKGKMNVRVDTTDTSPTPGVGDGVTNHQWYLTRWDGYPGRGLLDTNHVFADGSVLRTPGVDLNDPLNAPTLDEQLVRAPNWGGSAVSNWNGAEWNNVPMP